MDGEEIPCPVTPAHDFSHGIEKQHEISNREWLQPLTTRYVFTRPLNVVAIHVFSHSLFSQGF